MLKVPGMKTWFTIILVVLCATSVLGTARAGLFDGGSFPTTAAATTTPAVRFDASDIRAFRSAFSIEAAPPMTAADPVAVEDNDSEPVPFASCNTRRYDGCAYYVKTIGCSVNCVGWCPPTNSTDPDCWGKKCYCANVGQ